MLNYIHKSVYTNLERVYNKADIIPYLPLYQKNVNKNICINFQNNFTMICFSLLSIQIYSTTLFRISWRFSFFFFLEKEEKAMKRRLTSDLAPQLITRAFLLVQVMYKYRLFFFLRFFCKTFRILSPRKLTFVHQTSVYTRFTIFPLKSGWARIHRLS